MSNTTFIYDNCCLLFNICLNPERISRLLECRFKSNSLRTSFDFKSVLPEKPSNHAKIVRSFLKIRPQIVNSKDDVDDERLSSESSDDEAEEAPSQTTIPNTVDDDYLNGLALWQPGQCQILSECIISQEEEEEKEQEPKAETTLSTGNSEIAQNNSTSLSKEVPATSAEDLIITFAHRHIKAEPITYDDCFSRSQLDGQSDFPLNIKPRKGKRTGGYELLEKRKSNPKKRIQISSRLPKLDAIHSHQVKVANPSSKQLKSRHIDENIHPRVKPNHQITSFMPEKTRWKQTTLTEHPLNNFKKQYNSDADSLSKKHIPIISQPLKSSESSRSKLSECKPRTKPVTPSRRKKLPMEHYGKTILDYFKPIKVAPKPEGIQYFPATKENAASTESKIGEKRKRWNIDSDDCIIIDDDDDDDDIQLIEPTEKRCSIPNNIQNREKLLDHAVPLLMMRTKWLANVELLLLEHISKCHEQNIQPSNEFYSHDCVKPEFDEDSLSYHIDASLCSIVVLNFIKMFIIRNFNQDQEELSYFQFGITSHLRYLLIELPTYNHRNNTGDPHCSQCSQYSLIISQLFDLLFDLVEYDVCEMHDKKTYRSSLIKDDYFNEFTQGKILKKNKFFRVKLIVYFIELIQMHKNQCRNRKDAFEFNESQVFRWIENFLRHIIHQLTNLTHERISMCFNVMELCLLFANKKENHIKRMALFLSKICEECPEYVHTFLFDESLLCDIRLLLISELIAKKFRIKLTSPACVKEIFSRTKNYLCASNLIDEPALLLVRSLLNAYADLIINIKDSALQNCIFTMELRSLLHEQLNSMHNALVNASRNSTYDSHMIKRMVILYRLLQCKWSRL